MYYYYMRQVVFYDISRLNCRFLGKGAFLFLL
ncbi:hypothetical protein BSNT_07590 [Bacillus subtilis subsp. natto BEST195]|nr:hypothetical protein BSNT_07590 [Bacillus subtilis subsp. natto BEST195]